MTDFSQSSDKVSYLNLCLEISAPAVLVKNPLVSVKMITYNHEPNITQAIEGVLQQETDFPIELVIGEDCSTDRTREIALNFQRKYPDVIRVITSKKNVGSKINNNRTREACRGKYVAFCEGDDYWQDPHKLKKQVDYMESHPACGLVYSSYDVYHCKENITIKDFIRYRKWQIIENPKVSDYFVNLENTDGSRVGVLTCTAMVRRNLYDQIVESDPYLHKSNNFKMGDTQLWVEMTNIANIHYIPESMATHIITDESASRSKDIKKVLLFKLSNAELVLYLCNKYNLPIHIKQKFEDYKWRVSMRLALYTSDAEMAEELISRNNNIDWKDWITYYGAKYKAVSYSYGAFVYLKNLFKKENEEWL
jgi:glycosyltransferase involved in cell wall biosynthesis